MTSSIHLFHSPHELVLNVKTFAVIWILSLIMDVHVQVMCPNVTKETIITLKCEQNLDCLYQPSAGQQHCEAPKMVVVQQLLTGNQLWRY